MTTVTTIGFIGTGRYTGYLLEGLFGKAQPASPTETNTKILLYDIDGERVRSLASTLRDCCCIVSSAHEVLVASDIVLLGVPTSQVLPLLDHVKESRRELGRLAGLVVMDGISTSVLQSRYPDLPIGAIMYNYFVAYRRGIVSLWRGTLPSPVVAAMTESLARLGSFLPAKTIHDLCVIRATAGVGVAVLVELVNAMSEGMEAGGLDGASALLVTESLLKGCAAHLATGGSIGSLGAAVPSPNSPVVARALHVLRDRVSGDNAFLRRVFAESIEASREVR